MPKEAVEAEERCELTEGTAYYVEANVLKNAEQKRTKISRKISGFHGAVRGWQRKVLPYWNGKVYDTG